MGGLVHGHTLRACGLWFLALCSALVEWGCRLGIGECGLQLSGGWGQGMDLCGACTKDLSRQHQVEGCWVSI